MNTGGPTGPAENREDAEHNAQRTDGSAIEQTRYIGKQCRQIAKRPEMEEKIKEYLQGRLSKDMLRRDFQRTLFDLSEGARRSMGLEADTPQAMQQFLEKTGCFDDIFLYEIEHDKILKEQARKEMLNACIDTADRDFDLTDENKKTLQEYLSHESQQSLVNFLETHRARKQVTKRAIRAAQLQEKTVELSDFHSIHNKIVNLDPTRSDTKRIQSAWNTLLGGLHIKEGEDIQAAFRRIHEEGTEGDLSAEYEALFGPGNTCMSQSDKDAILQYLVRCLVPTISFDELVGLDSTAAKKIVDTLPDISENTTVTDVERKEAIISYRKESARSLQSQSYATSRLATSRLDRDLQVKILGTLGSKRRIESLKNFHNGKVGSLGNSGVVDFEESFLRTYQMSPEDVMTDESLREKLQSRLGNRMKNVEKFMPGNIMMWRKKGASGQRDFVGYYVIDEVLGNENSDGDSEVRVRFIGSNTSADPNNPHAEGRLTRGGISRSYNGPQFFDYLMGADDDVTIDFVEGFVENDKQHANFSAQLEKDQVRFYTDVEAHAELRAKYGGAEISRRDIFDDELDRVIQKNGDIKKLEADQPEKRHIQSGTIFALQNSDAGECETFQIEEITEGEDGEPGTIRVWDGFRSGEKGRKTMTFLEFIHFIKKIQEKGNLYRLPGGTPGKGMTVKQFNMLMSSKDHNTEGGYKKNKNVCIQEGKLMKIDGTGMAVEQSIVRVGEDKDWRILGIEGDMIEVSQGTFKDGKMDEKTNKIQAASFKGTAPMRVSLTIFWEYLQKNTGYELTKPKESFTPKVEEKGGNSWWNIFKHAHSLGVLLHGDLWKAPFKAWEEQHHKDHAFHGKLTAALAMEKLQQGGYGPLSGVLNWAEWPSLMVAESNESFQSYVDGLVTKIDNMGSMHRTRLIKKWARSEHFPAAKFMAAMFASMVNFGQLYPYDDGFSDKKKDPRNTDHHGHHLKDWFWYNSICHSLDPGHKKYPHMPPHDGAPWPDMWKDKEDQAPLTEIQACYKLFGDFKHPMLTNLGRRFQKYMNKGHEGLVDGGKQNLEQRNGMIERLDWMMTTAISGKPTELFGAATNIWLAEGYRTEISTMPYAAMLIGNREQQLVPKTQTHARDLFQSGNHVPMLVFMQNKALGDTFRETAVAFAYTISQEAGDKLKKLIQMATPRINGDTKTKFSNEFQKYWKQYGRELMHKMTGMRDPMLNLMINAPDTFDEMLEAMPEGPKKKNYQELKERRRSIQGYYDRLYTTYDSPSHVSMPRDKAFYTGDHFRFRDQFDVGYPIAWVNWDAYFDANLDKNYAKGEASTDGDGIFNEIRGFLYAIPKMAKKMAKDMGFGEGTQQYKHFVHKISQKLYHKNIEPMRRLAKQKIKATSADAEYCSMTAMMFGMIDIQEIIMGGSGGDAQARYKDYFNKMKAMYEKAENMEESDRADEAIEYRMKAAEKWSEIVKGQINTSKCSIEDIEKGRFGTAVSSVATVTSSTLEDFEAKMTKKGTNNNIVPFSQQPEQFKRAA